MKVTKAGPDIVNIRDGGFDVNTNNMALGELYVFQFRDSKYVIRVDGDGILYVGEVE